MIVDPDFLDHWRTGMVADAIGDPMAPIYILRLWAHCQERKSDTFTMPSAGLKAQCKCPAPADVFEKALIDAGFLKRDGDTITVIGWAEKNASLIAAWENGSKGGRPKKNPAETHGFATGNPAVTHGQPMANPDETDKSREEKKEYTTSNEVVPARQAERSAFPDCPHLEILALWAEVLPSLPQHLPTHWGGSRADHLRARWRETAAAKRWTAREDGLAYFRRLFGYIGQSEFLTGRSPVQAGRRPFVIELEWLVNPTNWAKVHEGKYHAEMEAA